MSGTVSHKLGTALEGALAGGGDPATSPLYVFGPFLKLIVVAGVAPITFGTSVWMVVLTIGIVSAMYRLVMRWITDGSGGSGLCEEEFGGWAVKVNAAITFVEYTLTFLVSMAAMVTFVADRFPVLNEQVLGIQYRAVLAIGLSLIIGWLVNRGPKMAARVFGPATAGVLLLLWAMIFATVRKYGFQLPTLDFRAFHPEFLHFTISGYVRILAVMTGIEVFANLVAAYEGNPVEQSRKAFRSLLLIMGTAATTMLIVGPAIYQLSDPTNDHVSVFTQTMDILLPSPLAYAGTLVGVAVLMSASAASAQGLQNLTLGLKERRYIPPVFGQRNTFEVATQPVWTQVAIVAVCFLLLGTHEETYLALYAAGVFILLSLTGWAVTKRLLRNLRESFTLGTLSLIAGMILASLLTTGATAVLFVERFSDGAWAYLIFVPTLYAIFTHFRNKLGEPSADMDYLGLLDATQLGGFGFGQIAIVTEGLENATQTAPEITWEAEPIAQSTWRAESVSIKQVLVLLDGSSAAAQALPAAKTMCKSTGAKLHLLSSVRHHASVSQQRHEEQVGTQQEYLKTLANKIRAEDIEVKYTVHSGFIAAAAVQEIESNTVDLLIISTSGGSSVDHWASGGVSRKLVEQISTPILLISANREHTDNFTPASIHRILVALDGSIVSERSLPYARFFAQTFDAEILLTSVPSVPEISEFRMSADFVEMLQTEANTKMQRFLNAVAKSLEEANTRVRTIVTGDLPAQTIVSIAEQEDADLIMLTSRGRGQLTTLIGSVASQVVEQTDKPVFMMPINKNELS